ncbi:heat shock 70 kDa protein 8-like [Trifolium pratense]|uniref:heat shock 70 kDa protein 8-like n=1 Tax=Trifolium pratense TaxID=57577 RepID=UPI001E693437|nr:heat shock 70 kDa protein 8-like [Trifolium pratense]
MTEPASTAASCSETTEEERSSLPNGIVIGIDIGTSPCRVSVWNGSVFEVWQNEINEMMIRFCETSKDHDFAIGSGSSSSSTEVSLENMDTIFDMNQFFNRIFSESAKFPFLMHTVDIKDRPFVDAFMKKLWRTTISEELLGKFLMKLTSMVETQLNRRIRNVVFTVPVSFSQLQINRIHRACVMADFKAIRLMPQPTAVAFWYVMHKLYAYAYASSHEDKDNESKKIALIFNMDAGYCDVSVIEVEKGKFHIKAMTGSTIGEEDLFRNMMCHLLPNSENIFKRHVHWNSDITSMASLRSRIHGVITKLSSETSVEVDLKSSVLGLKIQRVVTRAEFEDANKEVFEKCENLIMQCLQDAKIEAENINDVIIVGGCGYIPRVRNLVTKICNGKEIYIGMNHLNAVLCGAAVAGAVVEASDDANLFTSQVTLHTIGIQDDGMKFVTVIPKNTSVPTTWNIAFSTNDNQTTALIVIYEGGEEGQMAEENNVLGNLEITDIPEAPKGVPGITLSMTIDHKNRLTVTASVRMPRYDQQSAIPIIEERMIKFDDQFLIRTKFDDTIDLVKSFNVEQ